jgi:hypothetical protein
MILPPLGVAYARGQPPSTGGAVAGAPGAALGAGVYFGAGGPTAGFEGGAWAGSARSGDAGQTLNVTAVTIATTRRRRP